MIRERENAVKKKQIRKANKRAQKKRERKKETAPRRHKTRGRETEARAAETLSLRCTLLNQTKPFSLCWFVLSFSLSFSFSFKFSFRKYNYLLQIHGRSVRNNAANCRPRTRRNLFIFKPIYTQFVVVIVFLFFRSAGGSPPFRPIGWPLCSRLFFCWSQFL